VLELSPKYWAETRERPEVKARLAELKLLDRALAAEEAEARAAEAAAAERVTPGASDGARAA
jgi:hypothetical protein